MEIEYGNKRLERQMSDAVEMKKAFGILAKKISQRLAEIRSFPNLAGLTKLQTAKCHALIGDRSGEWAVSISGNVRLIFEIANHPIPMTDDNGIDTAQVTKVKVLRTEDYH
jgi:proteic killer suppression protein